jgi:hypothetical protein
MPPPALDGHNLSLNRLGGTSAIPERELSTALASQIVAMPQVGPRALFSQERGLPHLAKTVYWPPMHYLFIILAVVIPLAAHGCAPATDRLPPDSVLDPRGT